MFWLAETQGSALKGVFLVVIPLIVLVVTKSIIVLLADKEELSMNNNKLNMKKALNVTLMVLMDISGSMAGSALLAKALYFK